MKSTYHALSPWCCREEANSESMLETIDMFPDSVYTKKSNNNKNTTKQKGAV